MPESKDNNELSMDELKDVSGSGMGLDRLGTQFKGKKDPNRFVGNPYPALKEDKCFEDDSDGNDICK